MAILDTPQPELLHRWQAALAILVDRPNRDQQDVFRAASRSLATLLSYRYAGVGILLDDDTIEVQCLWNSEDFLPTFRYAAAGTPCFHVYGQLSDQCAFDRVADRFPEDKTLRDLDAHLYCGALIRSEEGDVIGHIFAIHDSPIDPSVEAPMLMRLISQWCSREISLDRKIAQLDENRRQLKSALLEAERANESHRAFLANVSHELRTPLNAVVGFAEALTLENFSQDAGTVRDYGGFIAASARHLLAMINDVLDISLIESGHMTLKQESVDVAAVAREAIVHIAQEAERRPVQISLAIEPDAAAVRADTLALRQILINLLTNAVNNTGKAGSIVIGTRLQDDDVAIFVQDTGVGIPENSFVRILQPFQRVDTGLSRTGEGTGLGLSIVNKLAQAMGGCLAINSKIGSGTTVSIILPRGV